MKKYIIEQTITPLANKYRVFEGKNGAKGTLIAFAQQKRFTMKEQVIFYGDESKQSVVFTVTAEKVMDIHGRFFIRDDKGEQIGVLRKSFQSSLLRSTYELMDSEENLVCHVQERSLGTAIFRRIWGLLPYIGDLPFFFKYHFDFLNKDTDVVRAHYNKTTRFRDYYELLLDDDTLIEQVGWQTLVAQAVMLDVMQGR